MIKFKVWSDHVDGARGRCSHVHTAHAAHPTSTRPCCISATNNYTFNYDIWPCSTLLLFVLNSPFVLARSSLVCSMYVIAMIQVQFSFCLMVQGAWSTRQCRCRWLYNASCLRYEPRCTWRRSAEGRWRPRRYSMGNTHIPHILYNLRGRLFNRLIVWERASLFITHLRIVRHCARMSETGSFVYMCIE